MMVRKLFNSKVRMLHKQKSPLGEVGFSQKWVINSIRICNLRLLDKPLDQGHSLHSEL